MSFQLPTEFQSSILRAKGFASYNEILNITPINTFNPLVTNEVIKFQFKTPDYFDPYDIYFDVIVEALPDTGSALPLKAGEPNKLYLDGDASALFQESQIYSRSRHIETIRMLDQVMYIVNSVGQDPDTAASQHYLGRAVQNQDGGTMRQPSNFQQGQFKYINTLQSGGVNGQGVCAMASSNFAMGYMPHKGINVASSQLSHTMSEFPGGQQEWANSYLNSQVAASSSYLNYCENNGQTGKQNIPFIPLDTSQAGSVLSYVNAGISSISSADQKENIFRSFGAYRAELVEALDGSLGVQANGRPIVGVANEGATGSYISTKTDFTNFDFNTSSHAFYQKTNNFGFQSYWSDACSDGNKCQSISWGYPKTWIANGAIQDKPVKSSQLRLQCPLNSGVMGSLLPEQKLLPGKAFGDIEIQLRLNPHAFFASGLRLDADQLDNGKGQADLTNYQVPRNWKLISIQLVVHTYSFDQAFTQQLESQLQAGITLKSNGFDFAQSTSVANPRFLQGQWPIISGIQSLKALYVYFLDEAYLAKTFCRKRFRVSGNVQSIQLKLNADYYPRRAVQGHAGNPIINDLSNGYDNTEFVVWYQKQLGFFNTGIYTDINNVNFAINTRSYDTSLTATTVYTNGKPKYKDYLLCGLPGQEEQRYVGKALYPFAFIQKPMLKNVVQGIDVSNIKPFEILIKTDQVNNYDQPVTLMILQHFNIEITMTPDGVNVYGYA